MTLSGTSGPLLNSLRQAAEAMAGTRDPWWVIGSAAVVLHGADTTVADIDLLTSERDAAAVDRRLGLGLRRGQGSALFRSALYGRWNAPPVPVEIMADLSVAAPDGAWHPLRPVTRLAVAIGDATVFVPDRLELIAILRRFGRTKDHDRAALLEAVAAG